MISVAVMAHESRRHLYEPMVEKLNFNGPLVVCEDDGRLGRWGNGRRCLLSYSRKADWHVVIQDDAIPAADILSALEIWLPHLPPNITCLYSGKLPAWRRIYEKHATPPCWLAMDQIQWGVALVFPTKYLDTLVKRADMFTKIGNYDMRLSEANLRLNRLPVLYPAVSWVQHAHTPSTVPGRKPNRFALEALTEEQSALDWGQPGEVTIIRVPDFQRRPGGRQYYGGRA